LIGRLFYLQIVRGEDYLENYELQIRKTRTVPGTRGNIFDRNGEVIAYNELAYSVTIEDIIPTDTKTEDKNKILNDTLDSVLSIVEENGDSVIDNFGMIHRVVINSPRQTKHPDFVLWRMCMEKVLLMILQKKKKIRQPSRSYIIYANDTDWIIPNMMPHIF